MYKLGSHPEAHSVCLGIPISGAFVFSLNAKEVPLDFVVESPYDDEWLLFLFEIGLVLLQTTRKATPLWMPILSIRTSITLANSSGGRERSIVGDHSRCGYSGSSGLVLSLSDT